MKYTFLFILLLFTFSIRGQNHRMYYTDVDFREIQADTLDRKLDTILFIGIGSSLERIFLEDLNDKLARLFLSKKISTSYTYLGKSAEEAKKSYNAIDKHNYNAILFFRPTDTSQFEIRRIKSNIFIPLPSIPTRVIRLTRNRDTYEQSYEVLLYKMGNDEIKIWSASVDIDCEPGKKNGANKLANKIFTRFIANGYIE